MSTTDHSAWVFHALRDGASVRAALAAETPTVLAAASLVVECLRAGGKVLLFGNGGSAADAQHISAELVGRFTVDRPPLAAIALTVDTSAITAIANDFGFDHVFERQLRALGRPGDVAIAISTSGRSESVLRAVRAARETGMKVVGLTGEAGRPFAALCDAAVIVPTRETARIQELHITVGHILCAIAEAELFGIAPPPFALRPETKGVTLEELLPVRERYRAQGRTVVWTNGCFDILHVGHVESLKAARRLGDVLMVGVNDDAQVARMKGPGRPIHSLEQRIAVLGALEMVDHVVGFTEPDPSRILGLLRPDIHCKGADYAPPHGAPIPEADVVRGYGGRIEFLPLVAGVSTTSIARRLGG
ncbi:MAG: HldE-like bifunctional protein [Labilithrix sp.]|nr:HldE-like bifunctional protein [Labilithrix sp.]